MVVVEVYVSGDSKTILIIRCVDSMSGLLLGDLVPFNFSPPTFAAFFYGIVDVKCIFTSMVFFMHFFCMFLFFSLHFFKKHVSSRFRRKNKIADNDASMLKNLYHEKET